MDGVVEGTYVGFVGLVVGFGDGSEVGRRLGTVDGTGVGIFVGVVGWLVGRNDGSGLGKVVGEVDGVIDGIFEVCCDGSTEGLQVGPTVGAVAIAPEKYPIKEMKQSKFFSTIEHLNQDRKIIEGYYIRS